MQQKSISRKGKVRIGLTFPTLTETTLDSVNTQFPATISTPNRHSYLMVTPKINQPY